MTCPPDAAHAMACWLSSILPKVSSLPVDTFLSALRRHFDILQITLSVLGFPSQAVSGYPSEIE